MSLHIDKWLIQYIEWNKIAFHITTKYIFIDNMSVVS